MVVPPSQGIASQVDEVNPERRSRHEDYCDSRPRRNSKVRTAKQLRTKNHLVEVFSQDVPQIRPLETNPIHVVVRDLDQLLETEQSRMLGEAGGLNFFPGNIAQGLDEIYDSSL